MTFLSCDVTINDLFYPFHPAVWLAVQSFIRGEREESFFHANKFLNVRGSIQQGDDQIRDESRGRREVFNYFVLLRLTMGV